MHRVVFFVILFASLGTARADVITFSDLAGNATYNLCGGAQNIGNFYASQGVSFIGGSLGDPVNSLDTACRETLGIDAAYPPFGSDINLLSQDDFAEIQFTSPVSSVSLEYVSLDTIDLTAFDSLGDQIAQSVGAANTDGISSGSDSLISASAANIAFVTLGNTGLADEYTFDDLSFTEQTSGVPEPGTLPFVLTCLAGFVIEARRRRLRQARHRAE